MRTAPDSPSRTLVDPVNKSWQPLVGSNQPPQLSHYGTRTSSSGRITTLSCAVGSLRTPTKTAGVAPRFITTWGTLGDEEVVAGMSNFSECELLARPHLDLLTAQEVERRFGVLMEVRHCSASWWERH
jgi:hypothetical protein